MGDFINLLAMESSQWFDLPDIMMGKDRSGKKQPTPGADLETFIRGMHNLGMLGEADALAKAVDLSDFTTMIDAGGGSGIYSAALCNENPELQSTLLDSEEVLAISRKLTESFPERDRISYRVADVTVDYFGENIDVVLVSDVIYDKSKADKVLKKSWNCLNSGGLLVVRGYYSDPENTNPKFGALFIINVLISGPDREILSVRTLQDCVQEAGFIDVKVSPLTELSTLLTARKP
jgi:predicted O-methyltransferase YrrM